MFVTLVIISLTFAAGGATLLWLAHASKNRKLPRNQLAGVRTRTTLHSDEAWYVAQECAAFHVQVGGYSFLVAAIAALVFMVLPLTDDHVGIAFTVLSLGTSIWVFAWMVTGSTKGNKAAREVIEAESKQTP